MVDCQRALTVLVTAAAPTAPALVASKTLVPAAANSFAEDGPRHDIRLSTLLPKPVTWSVNPRRTLHVVSLGTQLSKIIASVAFMPSRLSREFHPPTGAGTEAPISFVTFGMRARPDLESAP